MNDDGFDIQSIFRGNNQLQPPCWSDIDIVNLVNETLVESLFAKVSSSASIFGVFNSNASDEGNWNDKCTIPNFETTAPEHSVYESHLKYLMVKNEMDYREYNSNFTTAVLMDKRVVISKVVMKTIMNNYHVIRSIKESPKKANKQQKKSDQVEIEQPTENQILMEISMKTLTTFFFSLMRMSWSSTDTNMRLICEDVLHSCNDLLTTIPALSLANASKLPKVARCCLDDVAVFLIKLLKSSKETIPNDLKTSVSEILLGLALLRGDIGDLLNWIQVSLDWCLTDETKEIKFKHFFHWYNILKSSNIENEDLPNEDALDLSSALLCILKTLSMQAQSYTDSLTGKTTNCIGSEHESFVWGSNSSHQLVEGNKDKILVPKKSASFKDAVQVEAGQYCTFVIFGDGTLHACGKGTYGRLGLGDSNNQEHLKRINSCDRPIIQVSSSKGSDGHTLALSKDGKVYSWGDGDYGKLGHGNTMMQKIPKIIQGPFRHKIIKFISAGSRHSAAITETKELYTWGEGEHGRLGHGDSSSQKTPKLVHGIGLVGQVATGSSHTIVLSKDGLTVWTFGAGDNGKLGHGDTNKSYTPKVVEALSGIHIRKVAAGTQCSMVLTSNGLIYVWGCGPCLGTGAADMVNLLPKIVTSLQDKFIIDLSLGDSHCLALTKDHEVYSWGNNSMGQCGLGHTATPIATPTKITHLDGVNIQQLCAGTSHSIVWTTPPIDRKLVALKKAYCVSVKPETFSKLHNYVEVYLNNKDKLQDFQSADNEKCFADQYLCYTLNLLSSHLMLAVQDETCSREILGKSHKPLLDLLLKLINESKDNQLIQQCVTDTLKNGAQYLLPKPEERIELLLSLLPKTSDDLQKASSGDMFLLNLLVSSVRDHDVISDIFGFNLAHTTTMNPVEGKMSDKERKTEALGMVMRLLLRSSALLTGHDLKKRLAQQKSEHLILQKSLLLLLNQLQLHLFSVLLNGKSQDILAGKIVNEYLLVICQHASTAASSAITLFNSSNNYQHKQKFVIDYLMHSLCGSTLFSLLHLILTLPPISYASIMRSCTDLFSIFPALNQLIQSVPQYQMLTAIELSDPLRRKPGGTREPFWAWVYDMQCTLSVVVGRAIHHGMTWANISCEERTCQYWLDSILVQNGIEEREKLREHAYVECMQQITVSTLDNFHCQITTELPTSTKTILDLANGPSFPYVVAVWNEFVDYSANEFTNFTSIQSPLLKATSRYVLAALLHHCNLFTEIQMKSCNLKLLSILFEAVLTTQSQLQTTFPELSNEDWLNKEMNKTLVEEYCQARLMTCCKLILSLKPARNEADELTTCMAREICSSITKVLDEALDNGTVVATILHKPLHAHLQRAKVVKIHPIQPHSIQEHKNMKSLWKK